MLTYEKKEKKPKSPFQLLNSQVGKAIYDLKWERFRPIQDESIWAITSTQEDVIISASTASGKTEAAFLPAISQVVKGINHSLKIIYISPLKALINDQFFRIENLCKYLNCQVIKWHGDASQSLKKKFLSDDSSGIMLITPESLEAFLVCRGHLLVNLFKDVDFYIVDEVHSFVGEARGDQLKSVLNRLDCAIQRRPRRILLSATMGNLDNYRDWLGNLHPIFIEDQHTGKGIKGSVRFFETKEENKKKTKTKNEKGNKYYKSLNQTLSQGKKLIFGNSKDLLEEVCSKVKSTYKENAHKIDIHHGSLSKEQREFVERRLKTESSLSVFCTNTLELGIDIGNIDEVLLISPPWSVASFIQRIGRSGRRENSKIEFSFILNSSPFTARSPVCNGLRVPLIHSIALVELMLEGWCEPGSSQTNSYSTAVHQIMSCLAQKRITTLEQIKKEIIAKSFSTVISDWDFQEIICHLIKTDYLFQDKRGFLTLGSKGDQLTEFYDFYSVFFTPEEWAVYAYISSQLKKLGTLPLNNIFKEGDTILFSGEKWMIKNIDMEARILQVIPSKGGNPPLFGGAGGSIHCRVHEKMKSIYESDKNYKYLTEGSSVCLQSARKTYKRLFHCANFLPLFRGSGVYRVVAFILSSHGYSPYSEQDPKKMLDTSLYFRNLERKQALDILKLYDTKEKIQKLMGHYPLENLFFEKFDHLLPPVILRKSFMNTQFDMKGYFDYLQALQMGPLNRLHF